MHLRKIPEKGQQNEAIKPFPIKDNDSQLQEPVPHDEPKPAPNPPKQCDDKRSNTNNYFNNSQTFPSSPLLHPLRTFKINFSNRPNHPCRSQKASTITSISTRLPPRTKKPLKYSPAARKYSKATTATLRTCILALAAALSKTQKMAKIPVISFLCGGYGDEGGGEGKG